ncbi:hypothetical protein NLI96_g3966 [Meripilus lineatus]|uniref:Uncharacterized protein n=1 Tax=Meripilus lineatus TaxID=2056292 RepID=A0AAD5V7V9_9APHY|nr:hypothetical protein NLI96_g3966 [Physisporinus lineatus]
MSIGEAKAMRVRREVKLGRIQEPEDVAKLVLLVSDEAEYITGQTMSLPVREHQNELGKCRSRTAVTSHRLLNKAECRGLIPPITIGVTGLFSKVKTVCPVRGHQYNRFPTLDCRYEADGIHVWAPGERELLDRGHARLDHVCSYTPLSVEDDLPRGSKRGRFSFADPDVELSRTTSAITRDLIFPRDWGSLAPLFSRR